MTETALERREPLLAGEDKAPTHWVRRTVLVIFCLGLLAAIGAVFTQVIAARVPEQRATLEKLITDRTGLAVRFDNVHFAWGMDGTSAVFERVELTDPVRGRVRVVAPELRVEFDTWDFLRHQQFSLGHVTLKSPDIDIIGDAEPDATRAPASRPGRLAKASTPAQDEVALMRRFTAWAELMPVGRVEVEGARVHLFRRGERTSRHDFTLSQAVVSRGAHSFNAFGTLLLSQDIGQSLFVSAKLDGVGGAQGADGELRVIARRVLLDKLSGVAPSGGFWAVTGKPLATRGRGTVDAKLTLRDGRIQDGHWQLSARELLLPRGSHFDHFTVQGKLRRAQDDFLLEFSDLQVTRGARLERAPRLAARLTLTPGAPRIARITASAERMPFMAAEFVAGVLALRGEASAVADAVGWTPSAGELRNLRFDSQAGTFSAQVAGGELVRAADQARIRALSASVDVFGGATRLVFDEGHGAQIQLGDAAPRDLALAGTLTLHDAGTLDFSALRLQSGEATVSLDGAWSASPADARPLALELAGVDRALLGDAWSLLGLEVPRPLADVQQGRIVAGRFTVVQRRDAAGTRVDWQRSRGSLELAGLATAGADVPALADAAGKLDFSRTGSRLQLTAGTLEELRISHARIDWPRAGDPRLRASAQGDLASPLLQRVLREQGLERLSGQVTLEAEARGERELRDPASWRVTARLSEASLPLGAALPPVERLAGTVRLSGGQLRALALDGAWLGGTVEVETRRTSAGGAGSATLRGVADAAPLLELLGHDDARDRVDGQLAWSGALQRLAGDEGWRLSLTSNLAGVESRLPAPFAKPRARALLVNAGLSFDARGIREFEIESGRDEIRGGVRDGVTQARFDIQGVAGEWQAAVDAAEPRLAFERLDLRRAPAVLASAGAWLPAEGELQVRVAELRHADRALGGLEASLTRRANGIEFSLESAEGAAHELGATGACAADARCHLEFTVDTRELTALLGDARLPEEWPKQALRASGELHWPADAGDILAVLAGRFEFETRGADSSHQLLASAVLADGQVMLANVQGTGPEPDQVFRGSGRVGLVARTYDLTLDYEQLTLAASAVPTPARMRLSRAWSSLRGSAAKRGWTETAPARRVQWHGSWE